MRRGRRGHPQREPEPAADAGRAVDTDRAAHRLDQLTAHGEADAGPGVRAPAAAVHLAERLEQLRDVAGRDADARVLDHDPRMVAVTPDRELHPAVVGELERVGEQVAHDLAQAHRIGHDAQRGRTLQGLHFQPTRAGGGAALFDQRLQQLRQRNGLGFDGQPAGFELFDISVPEKPRSIPFFDCSGPHSRGVHQLWFCDGEYVHTASGAPDFVPTHPQDDQFYRCFDVRNPSKPVEVGRWHMPGILERSAQRAVSRPALVEGRS